jgi:Mor family transcriptional regulator
MKRTLQNHVFVRDMIEICSVSVGRAMAITGVRALCRYFGGQMEYIPAKQSKGMAAEKLRGVLSDATSDAIAEKMLERIMQIYGGLQVYFPLERCGFKHEIALEIFLSDSASLHDGTFSRKYGIAENTAYKLWHEGQRIKIMEKSPKLDFGQ